MNPERISGFRGTESRAICPRMPGSNPPCLLARRSRAHRPRDLRSMPLADRHESGPLKCLGRATAQRVRRLAGIAAGNVGRGMAEVPAHLFERHPVVDEKGRRGMPDPVRTERPQAPAPRVIAAGEHERDRVHRERLHAVALAGGDEEPARVVLPVRTGLLHEEWPPAFEVGEEGSPGLGLEGDIEGLA